MKKNQIEETYNWLLKHQVNGLDKDSLSGLVQLTLQSKSLIDSELEHLKPLENLKLLQLGKTGISDDALTYVNNSKLEALDLHGNKIDDYGMSSLIRLNRLEELVLAQNPITDECLIPLKELSHLNYLDLSLTHITDNALKNLLPLKYLTRLSLDATDITDDAVCQLERLKSLKELYLYDTELSFKAMEYLKSKNNHLIVYSD